MKDALGLGLQNESFLSRVEWQSLFTKSCGWVTAGHHRCKTDCKGWSRDLLGQFTLLASHYVRLEENAAIVTDGRRVENHSVLTDIVILVNDRVHWLVSRLFSCHLEHTASAAIGRALSA